ncbi:MAG: matrixin family metalloprotease [Armatimonadetes bacterium]|nr:matrixin family metalloprotease [Armatimonadota bacterium]
MARGLLGTTLALLVLLGAQATAALPQGYQVRRWHNLSCRLDREMLPWKLYSGVPDFHPVFLHGIRSWNNAGHMQSYPDLFAPVPTAAEADLVIDWNGRGLPADKAGAVWWGDGCRVLGLSMEPNRGIPAGNLAQIFMQELGHVLGLGDSTSPGDIMYPVMHRRRYAEVTSAVLSDRDRAAFTWLYNQAEFHPIRPPQDRPVPMVTPVPEESSD